MSYLRDLFGDGPAASPQRMARRTDPETSHAAAAEHVASGANAAQRAACLRVMSPDVGMTSDEIAAAAGIERHASARRLPELERDGLVVRGPARLSQVGGRVGVTWLRHEPRQGDRP